MNTGGVVKLIKKELAGRTQAELSKRMGISPAYLCDILQGKREPGPKVLKYLRLQRSTEYLARKEANVI